MGDGGRKFLPATILEPLHPLQPLQRYSRYAPAQANRGADEATGVLARGRAPNAPISVARHPPENFTVCLPFLYRNSVRRTVKLLSGAALPVLNLVVVFVIGDLPDRRGEPALRAEFDKPLDRFFVVHLTFPGYASSARTTAVLTRRSEAEGQCLTV